MFRLVNASVVEEVIKRSRFVAQASAVSQASEALAFLKRIRDARATHHCWAYSIGQRYRFSDDAEPGGTAGKPILNVIQHKWIGDVAVVVIRYFGGIKLGAGGLVRAYGGAAEAALSSLPLKILQPTTTMVVELDFSMEQPLRHWLDLHAGTVETIEYRNRVYIQLRLDEGLLKDFNAFCGAHDT